MRKRIPVYSVACVLHVLMPGWLASERRGPGRRLNKMLWRKNNLWINVEIHLWQIGVFDQRFELLSWFVLAPSLSPNPFIFVRLSLHTSQVAHQAGAYPSFCSMKRLGVFLLVPGSDVSPYSVIVSLLCRHSLGSSHKLREGGGLYEETKECPHRRLS